MNQPPKKPSRQQAQRISPARPPRRRSVLNPQEDNLPGEGAGIPPTEVTRQVPRRRPNRPIRQNRAAGEAQSEQTPPTRVDRNEPTTRRQDRVTRRYENGPRVATATAAPSYPPANRRHDEFRAEQASPLEQGEHPARTPRTTAATRPRFRWYHKVSALLLALLLALLVWAIYLFQYGSSQLLHVDALSDRENTPGTTYLIIGSDERDTPGGVEGKRSDTLMLLHKPESGAPALISIPRDSLVEIPGGYGYRKINSAFSLGGPALTVETVENLTGLTVDHYLQIGMNGVEELTDAVGGIELCYDGSFTDTYAKLTWEAGCHEVDGATALKFSRMRYSDPRGDIGRTMRQRQVVSKIIGKALQPGTLVNPLKQRELVGAVARVLSVSEGDGLMTVAQAGLALRSAMGPSGITGTPPIADLNYRVGGQSTVLLDPDRIEQFWDDLAAGELTPEYMEAL